MIGMIQIPEGLDCATHVLGQTKSLLFVVVYLFVLLWHFALCIFSLALLKEIV